MQALLSSLAGHGLKDICVNAQLVRKESQTNGRSIAGQKGGQAKQTGLGCARARADDHNIAHQVQDGYEREPAFAMHLQLLGIEKDMLAEIFQIMDRDCTKEEITKGK